MVVLLGRYGRWPVDGLPWSNRSNADAFAAMHPGRHDPRANDRAAKVCGSVVVAMVVGRDESFMAVIRKVRAAYAAEIAM